MRGQYKNAADAFLKGYKKYKSSEKAPDTLLKLGMSLATSARRCGLLDLQRARRQISPSAEHILDQAKGERKKAGC